MITNEVEAATLRNKNRVVFTAYKSYRAAMN